MHTVSKGRRLVNYYDMVVSMTTNMSQPRLGGVSEVADEIGVSRQQVAKLRQRDDFPAPIATLSVGDVWDLDVIRRWADSGLRRRAGRPAANTRSIALGRRFELASRIGGGGFAVVYHAQDLAAPDQIPVAVKVLKEMHALDDTIVARFERELRLMSQFTDPHVMPVLASGTDERLGHWYAMPLARGSLADQVGSPMDPTDVAAVMRDICAGLTYIHQLGIYHRDLKPANVLRTQDGAWAIADFGLAREVIESTLGLTSTSDGLGTPFYMAPEQWREAKRVDARADVYSAGKIMQALVSGEPPADDDVPPGRLRTVILRAISTDPNRRHESAAELLAAIEAAVAPAPTGVWEAPEEKAKRLRPRLEGDHHMPDESALAEVARWADELDDKDREEPREFCRTLSALQTESIKWWWKHDPGAFERVFRVFTDLLEGSFGFSTCDVLANFTRRAVKTTNSPIILQQAITGLANLGRNHNRWHVQDVTVAILQDIQSEEDAATALEGLRIAGKQATEWTLGDTAIRTLHPVLRSGLSTFLTDEET